MFLDDETATARVRSRGASLPFWICVVALAACIVLLGGLISSAGAVGVANTIDLQQSAGGLDHSLIMGMLVLAFVMMAVASRAVRRRTIKDFIAADTRRRPRGRS